MVVDNQTRRSRPQAVYSIRRQRGLEAKESSSYNCAGYQDMDPDEVGWSRDRMEEAEQSHMVTTSVVGRQWGATGAC